MSPSINTAMNTSARSAIFSPASLLSRESLEKINSLNNPRVLDIINEYIALCKPSKVTVLTGTKEDINYVRELSIKNKEEARLAMVGHTVHYDGYYDQGRDKANTRVLIPKGTRLPKEINSIDRDEGLKEIMPMLDGIMKEKEMLVSFYCLGPENSRFSLCALQMTDSAYVTHSENMLYRQGYEQFKRLKGSPDFFYFVHSAGELDERGCTKDISKRRIFIDIEGGRVFTINNQYAGNSVGLKKLALRLAIKKANDSDWLTEHMFLMGVHPLGKDRVTYFTGAYPSACGKTSTAMIPGQTIIGDDIAYLRVWDDGSCHAVNVEAGIFGIIEDINPADDPLIYKCLTTPRETIFINVLVRDGKPYWLGMKMPTPKDGMNHSGEWHEGKLDKDGKIIPLANKNARYTVRLSDLGNIDSNADNPDGVKVDAFIYGCRDSDTNVPVSQSLSWSHGVFMAAALESETTAATLGKAGVLEISPMSNIDFLVVPLGKYIANHLAFGERLDKLPLIFSTNYFLKGKDGKFLTDKLDKKVWLLWMEGRVHGEYEAIETPVGYIPKYEDLRVLFMKVFKKEFTRELYIELFSIRVPRQLSKLDRIEEIYSQEQVPKEFWSHLSQQRERLIMLKEEHKSDVVSPFEME